MQGKCAPDTRRALDGDVSSMDLHDFFAMASESPSRPNFRDSWAASASWKGSKIELFA